MSKVEELLESISGLTLVEAYELVKAIEDRFEVSACWRCCCRCSGRSCC